MNCAIVVTKIDDDLELISSDNPVNIRSVDGNRFHLFDPTNIFRMPLDRKHTVTISPNNLNVVSNLIHRQSGDKMYGLISNFSAEETSEKWIYGYPGSVKKHIKDQIIFKEHSPENLEIVNTLEKKAKSLKQLSDAIDKYGYPSYGIAQAVKEVRKDPSLKDDPELKKLILDLARHGYLTV
jgi:hypothetical protein